MIAAPVLRSEYPLTVRDKIERLWRMAFGPTFPAPFSKTFSTVSAAEVSWWLSGGITAGQCVGAYDAKNAASLALSYVNLANPGTDITLGVAPTWANGTGWTNSTGLITGGWLNTNINFPSALSSIIVRFSGIGAANLQCLMGCYDGAKYVLMRPRQMTNRDFYNGGQLPKVGNLLTGTMCLAGNTCYENGLSVGTLTVSGVGTTVTLGLLCYKTATSQGHYTQGTIQAAAIYNIQLSDAQALAVSTAMLAL